ncbi:hypothetical protein MIND_00761000 [Mycena indigotica]|uniref:INO80 complex subunit F domain-containing protein n=1 Tax=Mycena indigotica TaxID=2126181 RepID=A0A8H6W1D2_9AGAR|nr:uncharacterized protein MIND_00761000 [Mycena indigotica]KAF7301949.1 hypothetical protein MIND_00761000 [Mycena indigotica]
MAAQETVFLPPINRPPVPTPRPQPPQLPYGPGLAAGANDIKYHAKYKDLKVKVKEIEQDNDKLHYKILQAKRAIQRMKLERAVLYERLQVVPPSSDMLSVNVGRLPPHLQPHEQQPPPMDRRPIGPMNMDRRGSIGYMRPPEPFPPGSSSAPTMYPPPPEPYIEPPPPHSSPNHARRHVPAALPGPDIHELAARSQQHSHSPPSDSRVPTRGIHNHQRLGPGTYINREDERDWDRDREHGSRPRDLPTASPSSQQYHRPYSRSNSPSAHASGSGQAESRPDSRDQFYDGDQPPPQPARRASFRLRPVPPRDDRDVDMPLSVPRNGGSNAGGPGSGLYPPPLPPGGPAPPPPLESRKRTRNEMEDNDDPPIFPGRHHEPRSSKRYHP